MYANLKSELPSYLSTAEDQSDTVDPFTVDPFTVVGEQQ